MWAKIQKAREQDADVAPAPPVHARREDPPELLQARYAAGEMSRRGFTTVKIWGSGTRPWHIRVICRPGPCGGRARGMPGRIRRLPGRPSAVGACGCLCAGLWFPAQERAVPSRLGVRAPHGVLLRRHARCAVRRIPRMFGGAVCRSGPPPALAGGAAGPARRYHMSPHVLAGAPRGRRKCHGPEFREFLKPHVMHQTALARHPGTPRMGHARPAGHRGSPQHMILMPDPSDLSVRRPSLHTYGRHCAGPVPYASAILPASPRRPPCGAGPCPPPVHGGPLHTMAQLYRVRVCAARARHHIYCMVHYVYIHQLNTA